MDAPSSNIVIVGGGAGGLELAAHLGHRLGPERVALVDKTVFHIWKPSLHEVAAGTLDVHREGLTYFMLAKDHDFTFTLGEMDSLDRAGKAIGLKPVRDAEGGEVLPARRMAYGTLVLAVGSCSNFFNTPGAAAHAMAIDSTEQAERFRLRMLSVLVRADHAKGNGAGRPVRIAIVGGGATGVELAAELELAVRGMVYWGLRHLDPATDVKIEVMEGAARLLPLLPERVGKAATRLLHERGIEVATSVRVAAVEAATLRDAEGREHPYDLCAWAAGIEAPGFLATLGLPTNRIGQLVVDGCLRTSDPAIYAFGDCAQVEWNGHGFVPARAQAAHQQVHYLYRRLVRQSGGKPEASAPFRFKDYGSLVSFGHSRVVGNVMGFLSSRGLFVQGTVARLMYVWLHLNHYATLLGWTRTGALALGRLLMRRLAPRVKLH